MRNHLRAMERHLPHEITVLPATRHRLENAPRLNPSQAGWHSIYLPLRDRRLSWAGQLVSSAVSSAYVSITGRQPSRFNSSACDGACCYNARNYCSVKDIGSVLSVTVNTENSQHSNAHYELYCHLLITDTGHKQTFNCRTYRVLVAEVRPCDATTSTTSLVEDGAADRVQARSACLPLLPWSCAIVPCEHAATFFRPWLTATSTLCSHRHRRRSADPSLHCRR